jgi:sulfur relay (sulfurtransferase) complex TusBCD TusD component (DsrE family)
MHFSDNPHAAEMAIKLANELQKRKVDVVLLLDVNGVQAAAKEPGGKAPLNAKQALSDSYSSFVSAGGHVLICPHCAKVAGLTTQDLKANTKIASEDEVAQAILKADKIIDY